MSLGQLSNDGLAISRIRIVNWQREFTLPAASVAVHVTVVEDGVANEAPDKIEHTGVTAPSTESVAIGSTHVTTSLVPLLTWEQHRASQHHLRSLVSTQHHFHGTNPQHLITRTARNDRHCFVNTRLVALKCVAIHALGTHG